jgi:hypothetical protein
MHYMNMLTFCIVAKGYGINYLHHPVAACHSQQADTLLIALESCPSKIVTTAHHAQPKKFKYPHQASP